MGSAFQVAVRRFARLLGACSLALSLIASSALPPIALADQAHVADDAGSGQVFDISQAQDGSLTASIVDDALVVTGAGVMQDFADASGAPWSGQAASITSISLPDGLESIGANAFAGMSGLAGRSVALPSSLVAVGDAAFSGDGLAAIDASRAKSIERIGAAAFASQMGKAVIYVANAKVAGLVEGASGVIDADTTALAVTNGGAVSSDAVHEAGKLTEDIEAQGRDFSFWTTDSDLMHPATSFKTVGEGVVYYARFAAQVPSYDEPQKYPGMQGDDQTVGLYDAASLPSAVVQSDIDYYGVKNRRYTNVITTPYRADEDICFAFHTGRGGNANGGNGMYHVSFTLPYITVCDADGKEVASYDNGKGKLKLFKIVFDGDMSKTKGNVISAFKIGVRANVLKAGTYTLRFGAKFGANNGVSFLGRDVDFTFTVIDESRCTLRYAKDSGSLTAQVVGADVIGSKPVDIVIPKTITDAGSGAVYSVTSVAAHAFADAANIRSISLGSQLRSIGAGAFSSLGALEWVKVTGGAQDDLAWGDACLPAGHAVRVYAYSTAASTLAYIAEHDDLVWWCLDDGVTANGGHVEDGGSIALAGQGAQLEVKVFENGADITPDCSGAVGNRNVVTHVGTTGDDWPQLTALANGSCKLVISGEQLGTCTLSVNTSGCDHDAQTTLTTLTEAGSTAGYQGNGSTITLLGAAGKACGATSATVDVMTNEFDETLDHFDNELLQQVAVDDAYFTLGLAGPGSAWGVERWDYADWKANHLEKELSVVDASGKVVAAFGDGLSWTRLVAADAGKMNSITLRVDPAKLAPNEPYALIAGAQLTGHNVAAALQTPVMWHFTTSASVDVANCNVSELEQQRYTGQGIEPAPELSYTLPDTVLYDVDARKDVTTPGSEHRLQQGRDYTVSYSDNVEPGTACALVSGKGAYSGTVKLRYSIVADIASAAVAPVASAVYTGKGIEPAVKATFGGKVLAAGKDYDVAYSDNVDAGTASIVLTGRGSYVGTVSTTFTIAPASISKASAALSKTVLTYSGKALKPSVKSLVVAGWKLVGGRDYSVSWSNNKHVGKGTVTVAGKGNWTGKKTLSFSIVPKGTAVKSVKGGKRRVAVKWAKQAAQASGYKLRWSYKASMKSAKTLTVKRVGKVSRTLAGLKRGKRVYVQVCTCKLVSGKVYSSAWSKAKGARVK